MRVTKELMQFFDFLEDSLHLGQIVLNKDWIFIYSKNSVFKINLNDKTRFNSYIVYHRDYCSKRIDDGTWHVQQRCSSIFYAVFNSYTHDWRAEHNTTFLNTTYRDFMRLFHRYQALLLMREIFERQDKMAALIN